MAQFQRLQEQYGDPESVLVAQAGNWPRKQELIDLFEEPREYERIAKLVENGDLTKLAEMLGSSATNGITGNAEDLQKRQEVYGANHLAEKKLASYCELVCDGLHDMINAMLLVMAAISFVVEMLFGDHPETGWIESVAIVVSVAIIVNVSAATDYAKERTFKELSAQLDASNKKMVIRGGQLTEVEDQDLVVGDILTFNAHNLASIPCDGLLLSGAGVKMDESSLTGEPDPVAKTADEHPWVVSGTNAVAGSGKMLVVAVGASSVSGKIRAAVYGEDVEEEGSPLFQKLDTLVVLIGKAGMTAALVCFAAMCAIGFGVQGKPWIEVLEYIITTITIVAVAVPEGLPLAVTLALAFSSSKMMAENNLVKHLDACETMGSATTICSDKTGTLTANRMTVRAAYVAGAKVMPDATHVPVGVSLAALISQEVKLLLATLVAVCSMDESFLEHNAAAGKTDFKGNPTECALLMLCRDLGYEYSALRDATDGRSEATKGNGKPFIFSSARKMMSWIVKRPNGGYRLYAKGASEIILDRCTQHVPDAQKVTTAALSPEAKDRIKKEVVMTFAAEAMRTIGLAYRDFDRERDWEVLHETLVNANGSPAYACETELTLLAITGIEDPLRPEVAPAIAKCNRAGIDVRMCTGDNLDTAVAIASRCGILREEHFDPDPSSVSGKRPKKFRAMEGKDFRKRVYKPAEVEGEPPVFDQAEFDKIWPYLRVMARAAPEDKMTLANGLNKSTIFADKERCEELLREDKITIFPDRQVVAMTGDGTNDAPALKRADVGFAMGISGTQIAKDACDIVLLDDNFASIVTAAKWGRNVFASICKFLQFQLTVNIVALTLAIIGSFVYQESPIAAVQMLWINLIMDSLASLALATEPPQDALLEKPPVNRTASMISKQMWFNMIGQGIFQASVCIWILFYGPEYFDVPEGTAYLEETGDPSEHHTILFNAFVLMTLANEINCRKLEGEFNVFSGISQNMYFVSIVFGTLVLQCVVTQYGGRFFKCHVGGISQNEWYFCVACAGCVLLWQQLVNLTAWFFGDKAATGGTSGEGGLLKFKSPAGNGNIRIGGSTSFTDAELQRRIEQKIGRQRTFSSSKSFGAATQS